MAEPAESDPCWRGCDGARGHWLSRWQAGTRREGFWAVASVDRSWCVWRGLAVQHDFPDRDAVKTWIIRNQLGRRNLTDYSRGVLALKMKPIIEKQAKERQVEGGKEKGGAILPQPKDERRTRAVIAKLADVSPRTMDKIERIEKSATPELKQKLANGAISISAAHQAVSQPKPLPPKPALAKPSPAKPKPPRVFLISINADDPKRGASVSGWWRINCRRVF